MLQRVSGWLQNGLHDSIKRYFVSLDGISEIEKHPTKIVDIPSDTSQGDTYQQLAEFDEPWNSWMVSSFR